MQLWRHIVLIAGMLLVGSCTPPSSEDGSKGGASTQVLECVAPTVACNGACILTANDVGNCGSCGVACQAGQECQDGVCGSVCTAPCSALQTCQNGQCVCNAGTTLCDGACVDLNTDSTHCGTCTSACSNGQTCQGGACQCPVGNVTCGTECTDVATSRANCGACGNPCGDIEECVAGACRDTRPGGDNCGGAARGIDVTKVTLNQAVEIGLFDGVTAAPSESKSADVIAGREALVRAFVTPRAEFSSRELSFRIHVESLGGEAPQVFHHKRVVLGASSVGSLDSTFQVAVPGAAITPDTKFWVELVECGLPQTGDAGIVRLPESGSQALEARQTGVVKVGFVPVLHDGRSPDTSDAVLKAYTDAVLAQYPIAGIESFVTTPIESGWSGTDIDLGVILDRVADKRAADDAPDDVYYFGLIKPAEDFERFCERSCTTGVAFELTETSPWYVAARAGIGVAFGDRVSAETFVHELGHNQGRPHAPCGVDGDADFPHDGAGIGVWGYDLLGASLKDPNEYVDFMSYCSPVWVSDYTYRAIAERVAEVNELAASPKRIGAGEPVTWAAIRVTPRGLAWTRGITTQPGDDIPVEPGVVYDAFGQELTHVDVFRVKMSENAGYVLYVPPREAGWFAVGLAGGPALPY